MKGDARPVDALTVADIREAPVWEFALCEELYPDETYVTPVRALPVLDLGRRVVGTQVLLRNGKCCWAILGGIDLSSLRRTQQCRGLSLSCEGKWFHLARYHDADYSEHGPDQLAKFLGLTRSEVFPISYDISSVAKGEPAVVRGQIPAEPEEKLSDDELIQLALE